MAHGKHLPLVTCHLSWKARPRHRTMTMGQFIWDDADVFVEVGLDHLQQGNFIEAIERSNQALALNPEMASAYFLRGNAFEELGAIDSAIEDYVNALTFSDSLELQEQIQARLDAIR